MEQQGADGHPGQQAGKSVKAAFAQLGAVLADGGQRWHGVGTQGQVVKADDAQILGDADAQFQAVEHHSMGQQVMAAQNGRYILLEQGRQVLLQTFGEEIIAARQMGVIRQPVFAQRVEKGAVPGLVYIGPQPAAEITNTGVPQTAQMGYRKIHPFGVVYAHITGVRICLDVVVQQHGRCVGSLQVVQPHVRKRQTQKQSPGIVVFEHILVVAYVLLGFVVQRDYLHQITRRFCCFAEANHNIIAKIVGLLTGHVFDKDAKGLGVPLMEGAGVTHLHGGLQNGFSQCFAHIRCAVQCLGDRSLGNIQFFRNILNGDHTYSPLLLCFLSVLYLQSGQNAITGSGNV